MATKKQIINDWQKIFPELKKQGSISLVLYRVDSKGKRAKRFTFAFFNV